MSIYRCVNRLWRIIATGFVFAVFGLAALIMSASLFPLLRLLSQDADTARKRIQHSISGTFRRYIDLMCWLGIMSWEVHGVERLRRPGQLVVANHPTLLDTVFLMSLMPEVDCIAKRGLWRNPFLRWPVIWAAYIPNSEGEELIEGCAASLRSGHSLLVFPEGTRSVPHRPMRLQRGAAHIALAADAALVPVTIDCDPPTLHKDNPWYRVPARRFHVTITVGEPVMAGSFRRDGELSARSARRLTQWLLAYYAPSEEARLRRDAEHIRPETDTARPQSAYQQSGG